VEDIDLSLERGQTLGLIGESGCGKSTLAMTLLRLLPPNARVHSGTIMFDGRDLLTMSEPELRQIRGARLSMVFQGAMNAFNPVRRLSSQIEEGIRLHQPNIGRGRALEKAAELFDLVGIGAGRVHDYPHQLSGGMKQRAMIAMALSCDPELVIADEPVTALDVMIQAQIIELLKSLRRKLGLTLIMITHDLSVVTEVCDRIAVMYGGKMVESADIDHAFKHPYTQKLFRAFPNIEKSREIDWGIPGSPPDLIRPPEGCRFSPRCDAALPACQANVPEAIAVGPRHQVSCHLYQ
jgi:peptide/nickel transport system ATP-binding protein